MSTVSDGSDGDSDGTDSDGAVGRVVDVSVDGHGVNSLNKGKKM